MIPTPAYAFPTTQTSAYGNERVVVAREIVPIDVQATITRLDNWFEPEVDDDEPTCESAERGLSSGFYDQGYLHAERESGLIDFHHRIRRALGERVA